MIINTIHLVNILYQTIVLPSAFCEKWWLYRTWLHWPTPSIISATPVTLSIISSTMGYKFKNRTIGRSHYRRYILCYRIKIRKLRTLIWNNHHSLWKDARGSYLFISCFSIPVNSFCIFALSFINIIPISKFIPCCKITVMMFRLF